MTVIYSLQVQRVIRRSKLFMKIVVLALIIFYIIPKLLALFWDANDVTPPTPKEQLLEKPLRVEIMDYVRI